MDDNRLQLGDLAKHCVTGFTGIVVATVDYLQGCRQICLQPRELQKESGEPKTSLYFDEPYVDLVERQVVPMRVAGGMLPEAEIVDMGERRRENGPDKAPGRSDTHTPPR